MASTGKTPNLGLCQWQLSDPFLMEDMNEDNRKVDAAVTALGSKAEFLPLKTVTAMTNNTAQVDVQVSDIDFTKWQCVLLDVTIPQSCEMRINSTTQGNYMYLCGSSSWSDGALNKAESGARIIFFSHCGFTPRIRTICLADNPTYGYAGTNFGSLSVLNFVAYSNWLFTGACSFKFWGVK